MPNTPATPDPAVHFSAMCEAKPLNAQRIHEILTTLAAATFRPFTATDYYGYAGAEGKQPLIAETAEFTAVIDDNGIWIDYAWIDYPEPEPATTCDGCQAAMINGVFCHETGCPNGKKTWVPERQAWVRFHECRECGSAVEEGEACDCTQPYEPDEDAGIENAI